MRYWEEFLNDMSLKNKKISKGIVASGIIYRINKNGEKEYLVIRRSKLSTFPNVWESPKGSCEKNETIENCLKREIKEETGLNIEIKKFLGQSAFENIKNDKARYIAVYNFLCKTNAKRNDVKLSKLEHSAYSWVKTKGEFQLFVSTPEFKDIINKVFINQK